MYASTEIFNCSFFIEVNFNDPIASTVYDTIICRLPSYYGPIIVGYVPLFKV